MGISSSTPEKQFEEYKRLRKEHICKEMRLYRAGYPDKGDDPSLNDNYRFYKNEIPFRPDGVLIEELLTNWADKFEALEYTHSFIQWLFPTREKGMNVECQPLQPHEAELIKSDEETSPRVLRGYKMMLHFYGILLLDESTGIVARGPNWALRSAHLNKSIHNALRITRILKSLGELGYEHLKYPLVEFLMKEVLKERTLSELQDSLCTFWVHTLKNDRDRLFLVAITNLIVQKGISDVDDLLNASGRK